MHQVTDDFPLLQWWPCSWLTEDCQVLPSSFSHVIPQSDSNRRPLERGAGCQFYQLSCIERSPIQSLTQQSLLNLYDLTGSHSSTLPLVTGKSSGGDHPWYPVCHNLWSWCFRTNDMSRTSWTEGTSPIWTTAEWSKALHSVLFHHVGLIIPSYPFEVNWIIRFKVENENVKLLLRLEFI